VLQEEASLLGVFIFFFLPRCPAQNLTSRAVHFLFVNRYRAGLKELGIIKKLMSNDPENKKHVIQFIRNFEFRNHLCLVFELLRYARFIPKLLIPRFGVMGEVCF
jgi:hypothetical protein